MANWLVKLEGPSFDLDEFPHWFPRGSVHAITDAEGTYLAGEQLEVCNDASEVHETAEALLDEMHAVIHLLDPSIRRPAVGAVLRVDDAGKRTGTVFASATISGRSKVRATLSVAGSETGPAGLTQAQVLLETAQSNRHLRIALSVLAMPHVSWPHLYRALEEIEACLKDKVDDAGICTNDERESFARSANSGEVAGCDARHRVGRFKPRSQPMKLNDAKTLIRICLDATLRKVTSDAA